MTRGGRYDGRRNPLRANQHLLPLQDEPWWLCTHCQCRDCEDRSFFCLLRQCHDMRRIERAQEVDVCGHVPALARVEA